MRFPLFSTPKQPVIQCLIDNSHMFALPRLRPRSGRVPMRMDALDRIAASVVLVPQGTLVRQLWL